jgi:hypothetical protein
MINPFQKLRDWWNRPILERIMANEFHRITALGAIRDDIAVQSRALGRVIAKIDPLIAVPEDDPKSPRRAESDAIGDAVIKRLMGEFKASNPLPRP